MSCYCKKCGRKLPEESKKKKCEECRNRQMIKALQTANSITGYANRCLPYISKIGATVSTLRMIAASNNTIANKQDSSVVETSNLIDPIVEMDTHENKVDNTPQKEYYCVEFKAYGTGQWYTKTITENKAAAFSVAKLDHYGRPCRIYEGVSGSIIYDNPGNPSFRK